MDYRANRSKEQTYPWNSGIWKFGIESEGERVYTEGKEPGAGEDERMYTEGNGKDEGEGERMYTGDKEQSEGEDLDRFICSKFQNSIGISALRFGLFYNL